MPQQAGLAYSAAAIYHQQPAAVGGRGELLLLTFTIDEGKFHRFQRVALNDVCQA